MTAEHRALLAGIDEKALTVEDLHTMLKLTRTAVVVGQYQKGHLPGTGPLQRLPLVLARERWLIDIHAQIQRVKEALINYNEQIDSKDTVKLLFFEKILKREMQRLKKFLDPGEQYVGMARQVIGKFLKENFGIDI